MNFMDLFIFGTSSSCILNLLDPLKMIHTILNIKHLHNLHIFDQKTKKLDLGEIYFVLNFQGCAICATGVGTKKYASLYIYLNPLKNVIPREPICFPKSAFSKMAETGKSLIQHSALSGFFFF